MTNEGDEKGWGFGAKRLPSPNFDERPVDEVVSMIVVHAISLPPGQFGGDEIVRLFTNRLDPAAHPFFEQLRGLRVSAHFLIRRDGESIQFVSCEDRAWHAGQSAWQGRTRCNDFSIGIELEGCDDQGFEAAQYAALIALIDALRASYPVRDIVGHADIAPGRKTDPGPHFEWSRLDGLRCLPSASR